MADEIDSATIKKTQEILGSVIKKPALTEKSLKKPPFRFLHDIINNIIKTSGFLKGLYTSEELQSENVKDKESKIAFLQKTIDVLAIVTNQPVNLKPSKVVAGHDPQKTNVFLQTLGMAVKNKLDSKEAVAKVLTERSQGSPQKASKERRVSVDKRSKGEKSHSRSLTKTLEPSKKSSSSSQNKESSKNAEKDSEKGKNKEKHKESKTKDREKSRERTKHSKKEDAKKTSEQIQPNEEQAAISNENDTLEHMDNSISQINHLKNQILDSEQLDNIPSPKALINGDINKDEPSPVTPSKEINLNEFVNEKPLREKSHRSHSSRSARPPSARSKRTRPVENGELSINASKEPMKVPAQNLHQGPSTSEPQNVEIIPMMRPPSVRPPSARPSSSRPAPPRIRIRHVVENEEPIARPETAKPVENLIIDQDHHSDEDEDQFIVVDTEPSENLEIPSPDNQSAQTPEEDKGSLVKKLLETKKDLEGGSQHTPTKKVEIDKSQMSEVSRNREKETALKEMENIRDCISKLSRSSIPLGRMLSYLQEDIDSMKMELKMWQEEHEQNIIALRKEQSATESALEPLRMQLDDLDQVVQNQLDANTALKSSIARNDERIQRMLAQVTHKS